MCHLSLQNITSRLEELLDEELPDENILMAIEKMTLSFPKLMAFILFVCLFNSVTTVLMQVMQLFTEKEPLFLEATFTKFFPFVGVVG